MPLPKKFLAKGPRPKAAAPPAPPKVKRAPRGGGSVFFDKRRGVWKAKVLVGRYPNGASRYREVTGRTQAEVMERRKAVDPPGPEITVGEWADRWLAESGARPSTRSDIAHTIARWIKPTLGGRRLAELTAADVERAVRGWALGPNTARKNLKQVRAMVEAARRAGLVATNVAADARGPKAKRVVIDPFTAPQLAAIVAAATDPARPALAPFALLATAGCRIGEALALDVPDLDAAAGAVRITKTFSRRHGTRRPKSENGVRTLRVPAQALPALRRVAGGRRAGPLFALPSGARQEEAGARYLWQKLLAGLRIPYRSVHTLRHSVATLMVARGTGLADVAKYLGDSLATVIATYVHPTGADVAGVIEAALGPLPAAA